MSFYYHVWARCRRKLNILRTSIKYDLILSPMSPTNHHMLIELPLLCYCYVTNSVHFGGLFCIIISTLKLSTVAFIVLSPSSTEASNNVRMRQFELYAIITQPTALTFVAACLVSGRLCLFT